MMETTHTTYVIKQPGRLIVIEPIVILYSLFTFPVQLISQLYILETIERKLATQDDMVNLSYYLNVTVDLCHMNSSDPVVVFYGRVQKEASYFSMLLTISACIPALGMSVFLGAYSDKAGRKYAIVPPLVANMLNTVIYIIVIMLNLSLWYLLLGAFISGLGGFMTTLLLGCFAYISDMTSLDNRRFRITVLEMCLLLPGILGPLGIGKLLQTIGYMYCFVSAFIGLTVIIIYVIFFVPETIQKDPSACLLDLSHMKRSIEMFTKTHATGRNVKLAILLIAFFIGIIPKFDFGLDTLYVKNRPLCMSNEMVGYYMSAVLATATFGGIIAAWLLKYCASDQAVAVIAGVASIVQNIYKAFVLNITMMFFSSLFGMFSVLFIPTIRTLMSTIVEKSEQGVVFGAIAFAEILCSIIGVAIFNPIYANTQHFMTGFVFIVMAMFYFTGCSILIVYVIRYWRDKKQVLSSETVVSSEKEPLLGKTEPRSHYVRDQI